MADEMDWADEIAEKLDNDLQSQEYGEDDILRLALLSSALRDAYLKGKEHGVEISDLKRRIAELPDRTEKDQHILKRDWGDI